MKISDFERAIERAHAPEAPPAHVQSEQAHVQSEQLRFEAVGEAGSSQAQSPADDEAAPERTSPGRTKTAVGYVRVSREDQTPGDSLATQRVEIDRYCERKGYELVRTYADEGASAHSDRISKRHQFSRLLEDAQQGRFDVVVVHSLDRWAPDMCVHTKALGILGDAKVGFASVTEDIDLSTTVGTVMMTLLAAFAEFFSAQRSGRSKGVEGGHQA